MLRLSQEEFDAWRDHPVTHLLRELAQRRKEQLKEQWASGQFTDLSQYGTAILNAKAIGRCEEISWFADLDYETFLGECSDE